MNVGFIGLGSMGLPMAQRIQSQGHALTLYARREASLEPFVGTGVEIASTPAEMGRSVDAVGICVFDGAGVEEVLFGTEGLIQGLRRDAVVLVHSTVSPMEIQEIADRASLAGLRILDAPVSGSGARALAGELTIMVGGKAGALDDVRNLLTAVSNHIIHLGDVGAGAQAKLINNTMFSAQIALTDDALKVGSSLGVDPDGLAEVLRTSSSACVASGVRLRATYAEMAASGNYITLLKDVALMAATLGEEPGKELVDMAERFVAGMSGTE
jgi:3-hydroxyisobutyrate dehydrogenase-like beta-hydroxyacid dehydrogenase